MMRFEWYPLYLREMWIFKKRLFKLSYVFAAMVTPIIYFLAFGLGLGGSMRFGGIDYASFLLPGLAMMTAMNNSYNWVAGAINVSRLMYKSFQMQLIAPIKPESIVLAYVFSGVTKGVFAVGLILVAGIFFAPSFAPSLPFVVGLALNMFCFASIGVIIGMIVKTHEESATWSNFVITPMAFFSGTFFPIEKFPYILKAVIYCTPLAHANILARKAVFDGEAIASVAVLCCFCVFFFIWANRLVKNYSE